MSIVSLDRPVRDCAPRLADLDRERASYRVEISERFNAVLDIVEAWASDEMTQAYTDREGMEGFWAACPASPGRMVRVTSSSAWFTNAIAGEKKRPNCWLLIAVR